jgi:hypothetical protein
MGTISLFMLKIGTRNFCDVETLGLIWPANGASPEIGNQLDLPVGERAHAASAPARARQSAFLIQQRHAEHGVVSTDFWVPAAPCESRKGKPQT